MAVYGYSRVSTDRQAEDGESLGVQARQIEGYVMLHGLVLDALHVEEGVSGSVPLAERPEGGRLMARLRAGDVVIAGRLDRVFRSALDALQMVEVFRKRGVALHLLDLGGDVTGNGLSRLFLTMAAAFAEVERDRLRERVVQVKADQKSRGRYLGGKLPYGYRVKDGALVEIPEQQAVVSQVRQMRAEGATLRAIRAALACDGVALSLDAINRIAADGVASAPTPGGVTLP